MITRRGLTAALFVALLISPNRGYAQGRVFADGFEGGNVSRWSQADTKDMCSAVRTTMDGTGTHSGTYMAECNWNGVVAWNDNASFSGLKLSSWPYSREFLIRLWVKYASDVDHVSGSKMLRLYPNNGREGLMLTAQMEFATGLMYFDWELLAGQKGPIFWGGDGMSLGRDAKWHKIEIYMKHNAPGMADGAVKIWQDGSIRQQSTNIVTTTPGDVWWPLHLMSNWSSNPGWEHDASNHVYWDDIEVYSDLGSGASGSMSDASIGIGTGLTPPSAPTNLRIVR